MRTNCLRGCLVLILGGSVIALPHADNEAFAQQPTPLPQPIPIPTQPGGIPPGGPGDGGLPAGPRIKPFPIVDVFPGPGGVVVPGEVGYPGGTNTIKSVLPYQAPAMFPEDRPLPINLV